MFQHVPNLLTGGRLLLAAVFFTLLGFYQYDGRGDPTLMIVSFVVYLIALVTDFLDGYLARLWKVEGAFGRVVDPFVDKVLVLGSFIFFAGKNFIIPDPLAGHFGRDPRFWVHTITGVAPWMVVIMLGRELLVTTFRGISESTGQNFGAAWSGKVKMTVQSITILIILAYVAVLPHVKDAYPQVLTGLTWFRNIAIYATLLITVYSGLGYVRRAITLYRSSKAMQHVG